MPPGVTVRCRTRPEQHASAGGTAAGATKATDNRILPNSELLVPRRDMRTISIRARGEPRTSILAHTSSGSNRSTSLAPRACPALERRGNRCLRHLALVLSSITCVHGDGRVLFREQSE